MSTLSDVDIEFLKDYGKEVNPFDLFGTKNEWVYKWANTKLMDGNRVEILKGRGWIVDDDEDVYSPTNPKGTVTKRYAEYTLMRRRKDIEEYLRKVRNYKFDPKKIEEEHKSKGDHYIGSIEYDN